MKKILTLLLLGATLFTACKNDSPDPEPKPIPVQGVSLNKTTLSLAETTKESLIATVTPDNATSKSVTWSSSDPAVATVNELGEVAALKAGTTTITATSVADKTKSATCAVTVVTTAVHVASITVAPTTATLEIGATHALTATVLPENATDKTVTWTSSNAAIATVSAEGVVTAVATGAATITATTTDGGKTAICTVTVKLAPERAKIGDFYYSDKTFSSTIDPTKTCIGIVFWVDSTDGTKGKVASLDEPSTPLTWGNDLIINAIDHNDGMKNTKLIVAKQNWKLNFPIFAWADSKNDANTDYSTATTGVWYVPAADELKELRRVKAAVNTALSAITGTVQISIDYYWSSTECHIDLKTIAWRVGDDSNSNDCYKEVPNNIRAILAF